MAVGWCATATARLDRHQLAVFRQQYQPRRAVDDPASSGRGPACRKLAADRKPQTSGRKDARIAPRAPGRHSTSRGSKTGGDRARAAAVGAGIASVVQLLQSRREYGLRSRRYRTATVEEHPRIGRTTGRKQRFRSEHQRQAADRFGGERHHEFCVSVPRSTGASTFESVSLVEHVTYSASRPRVTPRIPGPWDAVAGERFDGDDANRQRAARSRRRPPLDDAEDRPEDMPGRLGCTA